MEAGPAPYVQWLSSLPPSHATGMITGGCVLEEGIPAKGLERPECRPSDSGGHPISPSILTVKPQSGRWSATPVTLRCDGCHTWQLDRQDGKLKIKQRGWPLQIAPRRPRLCEWRAG